MKTAAAAIFLLLGLSAAFAAAPIYRCGGPDGRVYSQAPCADGRLIDAADPRSEAQRDEARRVVARERKAANDMERERRAQEAAQEPSAATGFNGRPAPAEAAVPPRTRAKQKHRGVKPKPAAGDFVAIEPRSAKTKP
jgi:hypothetical protein